MNITSNNVIIFLLSAILVIALVYPFIQYRLHKVPNLVPITMKPEDILSDLDTRIERYVSSTIQTKLMYNIIRSSGNQNKPNMSNTIIIKEDFLENTVAETTLLITSSFSVQYKMLISSVIPEDKIEDYVVERVYLEIFNFSKDYNFEVLGITNNLVERDSIKNK